MIAYKIMVDKPEGRRPLGRTRRRRVVNIKMDLREIEWDNVDGIVLVQDRALVKKVKKPSGSIKCWEFLE
jgi:hypothetical protein